MLASLTQDIRYGLRNLRRSPVFTLVAVLSIGGGLAVSTGIFAFADALVNRPLGVGDGRTLHEVFTENRSGGLFGGNSYADAEAILASPVIASGCATARVRGTITSGGAAAIHPGELVNPGCFAALQLIPAAGRFFDGTERVGPPSVVISHTAWQRRFGGDPAVVGQVVELNGRAVVLTGVAPFGFAGTSFDTGAEFWAPVDLADVLLPPGTVAETGWRGFNLFARLAPGVGRAQAEAALAVVAAQLRDANPAAWITQLDATRRITVMPEVEARFAGAPDAAMIGIVGGTLGGIVLILAIACLNLSTMLLARGAARSRELAIRLAIGASRGRLLRQLATESLVIAALGAVLAAATLAAALRLFEAYRPAVIPAFDVAFDWRTLAFGGALTVLAALLFGMAPALHALRIAVGEGLKGAVAATRVRRARFGLRDALIVLQVGVSSALLLVSTLFAGALSRGAPTSPGFAIEGVLAVEAHLDAVAPSELPAVNAQLLEAAARVPDVDGVTASVIVPMTGSNAGFYVSTDRLDQRVSYGNIVAAGYFTTLGIPVRAGREFDAGDRLGGELVAIVSEGLARELYGEVPALGQTISIDSIPRRVVGVVGDVHYKSLSEPPTPLLYLPLPQRPADRIIVHARYRGGAATLAAVERAMREATPRAAVDAAQPLAARMELALMGERLTQVVGAVVGIAQLFLALMALWGLVAYTVERRTLEMGVRLALGATPQSLVRLTMRPAAILIVVGVVLGTGLGTAIAQVVRSASVGLAPLQLGAIIPVALAFTAVALAAAWWPARRAGQADPAESLRRE